MILADSGTNVVRRLGLTSLLLGPVVVVLDRLDAVGELTLFVLAAAALIPISWLIGEATDSLARYTGPGVLLFAYSVLAVSFYLSGNR